MMNSSGNNNLNIDNFGKSLKCDFLSAKVRSLEKDIVIRFDSIYIDGIDLKCVIMPSCFLNV